jgi:peptidoglycan/LPS O-acetylase OafA/YrhL
MISRTNNFDLIRLFAAFQVLIFHSTTHLELTNEVNFYILDLFPGVLMFFVMSGFLIMSSLDRNPDLKNYTTNRILRIFPGLYICLLFTLILLLLFNIIQIYNLVDHPILTWIFAQSTFFQFWTPDLLRPWGVGTPNGSLWTITVELQFYFILPLLLLVFKKIRFIYKILVSAIFFGILNYYLQTNAEFDENILNKLLGVSFLPYINYFFTGVIIYLYWNNLKFFFEGKALLWLIFFLGFCFVSSTKPSYHPENFEYLANFLLSGLTISSAFTYPHFGKILKRNDISYGVYIYHMLVINSFVELGLKGKLEYLVITIIVTTLLGILSWFLVEKKALSFKKKNQ